MVVESMETLKGKAASSESLTGLLNGVHSKESRTKYASVKTLRSLSETNPEMLYSEWKFFEILLDSENNILKWNAMDIIANLTKVDSRNEFSRIFAKYYGYLYEGSLITAGHVVDNSAKIIQAAPELRDKITEELLKAEKVPLPTEECRNILVGKTIWAFQAMYGKNTDNEIIVSFVKRHLHSNRNATRVKAEKFLKKPKC